jgi:ribosomal protein S11
MSFKAKRTLKSIVCASAMLAYTMGLTPVDARAAELTDKSVATLMNFAWGLMPDNFTMPDGRKIVVDKTKRELAMVPVDVAREVIKVADRSANAQRCKMNGELVANQRTMMKREADKKQWSDQQMLYINTLHLFVVMLKTGKVDITEQAGENEVKVSTDGSTPAATPAAGEDAAKSAADTAEKTAAALPDCTADQKKAITDAVLAYVKG